MKFFVQSIGLLIFAMAFLAGAQPVHTLCSACHAEQVADFLMHPHAAKRAGLANDSEITIETRRGRASFRLKTTAAIREDTIFVPFHWPDEQSANRLTNDALDPISRMPEFKVCAARITAAAGGRDNR